MKLYRLSTFNLLLIPFTLLLAASPPRAVAVPVPEIAVSGNVLIADGDNTPAVADGTDFGNDGVGGDSRVRTFTIRNLGAAPLNLTGNPRVTVSGVNAADFTVNLQPAPVVAASGFTTFQVTFNPTATGTRTATLSIANDDSDENPFDFAIQGTGINDVQDPTFNPNVAGSVYGMAVQADGRIAVGGSIFTFLGVLHTNAARFFADGTLDPAFNLDPNLPIYSVAVQADGQVLVGGNFTAVGAVARNGIARIHANGTLDPAFNPNVSGNVYGMAVQADGRIVIGGFFNTVGGVARNHIARLNADGTLDSAFNPNLNAYLRGTAIQDDGRMVIWGTFTTVGGVTRNHIARLNADGTLDLTFNPDANGVVESAAIQADGRIVIGGDFTTVSGGARSYLARLNRDGAPDSTFNPDVNGSVGSMAVQANGQIVIGGSFTLVSGVPRNRTAQLSADGILDSAINSDANGVVFSTAVQADGRILVGGIFSTLGGSDRPSLQRLVNGPATQTLTVSSASRLQWLRGGTAPETTQVSFELSSNNGATWTPLGAGSRINGGWELTGVSLPASGTIRARARTTSGFFNGSSGLVEQQVVFTNAPFVQVPIANLPGVSVSAVAWGDYNNDGRLDFLLTGYSPSHSEQISQLWRNTGNGFTEVPIAGLPGVGGGSVAWGDYDNDGRLDFLLTGFGKSQLWRNTGSGFTQVPIPGLPGLVNTAAAWGDYNNDGWLDFLLTGGPSGSSTGLSQLWKNTGSGFTQVPIPGLPGVSYGSASWGDYDDDGRLDFLVTGIVNATDYISQLWRNTGSGFTQVPIAGLPGVASSAVAWGDYDNDGRLDFLLTGNKSAATPVSQLWRNTGSGFTQVPVPGLPAVAYSSVAWGDYDNDGLLDFLLSGSGLCQVWRNTGSGFTNAPVSGLPGFTSGGVAWADYDSDGRLDFLGTGDGAQLWKNYTLMSNTPPTAPTALASQVLSPSSVTLRWNPATDAQTPSAGLSYNLVLGTSANAVNAASPNASVPDGFRRVVRLGTVNGAATGPLAYTFTNLPPAPQYFWSVQAIDSAYAGGPFAPAQSFLFETTLITVLNTNDSGPGSLRQAIADISAEGTISFAPDLNGQTIGLTSGELVIDKHLTITGPGADKLRLSGNGLSRVIRVASNAVPHVVTITDLTIANGNGTGGGALAAFVIGGGILNHSGSLTVLRCTIADNTASSGGGIHNWGQAGWASLTVRSSTFSGNSGDGGGIFNAGTFGTALLHVEHCTFSGNSGTFNGGGAIWNEQGVLTLIGSTLTGNRATRANGLAGGLAARGIEHLTNTIVMGNFINTGAEDNINWGNIDDYRTCLIGPPNASSIPISSLLNTNLAFNGGPTRTHALVRGSPAIDAGPGNLPNAWQITDASGVPGSLNFSNTLSAAQKIAATNSGWHFTVISRQVQGSGGSGPAQFMTYGHGDRRFIVGWDLDASGRLTARFYGAGGNFSGIVTNLTGPGEGSSTYHQHELVYSPVTRTATYLLDGTPVYTWTGLAPNSDYNGQALFGAGANGGRGGMNFHRVQFAVTGQGTVSEYFAGYAGNPAIAPDPATQGWTRTWSVPANTDVTNAPVSPDAVALPSGLLNALGLLYDQRGPGFDRVGNGRLDIGAYEVQQPKVTQAGKVPQGFAISFKGEPNETLNIEWNTDARNVGWQPLTTGTTDASGSVQVIDSTPNAPRRFYRSLRP